MRKRRNRVYFRQRRDNLTASDHNLLMWVAGGGLAFIITLIITLIILG